MGYCNPGLVSQDTAVSRATNVYGDCKVDLSLVAPLTLQISGENPKDSSQAQ